LEELRRSLSFDLPFEGEEPSRVIEQMALNVEPGIVAESGPRYFGFMIGGSSPVSVAADWLTSAWDQNAGLYATSPGLAVVEETAARWVLDILGLPPSSGVGFVTGCQMANFTCLAAARGEIFRRMGWDVEKDGINGAPPINVVVGEEVHVTVLRALRFLGLGYARAHKVSSDEQGRMRPSALHESLTNLRGGTIVCAQAGNLNSGSIDPMGEISELCKAHGAWLHVDGAFGLWANAAPSLRHLLDGVAKADSWATDAHKWLNVPYDSGIAIVRQAEAQRLAMTAKAEYLIQQAGDARDAVDWGPEFSRRARGFAIYAQLRALGKSGVEELIERSCTLARRASDRLAKIPGASVVNDVVLNQVMIRFNPESGVDADAFTGTIVRLVQQDGICWLSGSFWKGQGVMRFSVCGAETTETDIDRSVDAIREAVRRAHDISH
jgi:glutamate/tyrosine decarboxylase-like PLP-dependent enzyme